MKFVPSQVLAFLDTPISLAKLELVVLDVPQVQPFKSAIGVRNSRQALVVCWHTLEGAVGYGECSCRPDPFYSHEFVQGALEVIKKFIFPQLKAKTTYGSVLRVLQKIRGWHFTKAAVEFAMNDAIRHTTGKGILEAWGRPRLRKVPVGISMGLFEEATHMQTAIEAAIQEGYRRLKFKINPAYTKPAFLEVLKNTQHPHLSFDANGSFTENDFETLASFARLGYMIEQPFAPGNAYLQKRFQQEVGPAIFCLDEEVESLGHLIEQKDNLAELNIKPGRIGGLLATIQMLNYCFDHSIKVWIGGMFETGIGRSQNLQIAAFITDASAHDQSPSSRYFTKDVLQHPIEMEEGYIKTENFVKISIDTQTFKQLTINKEVLKR